MITTVPAPLKGRVALVTGGSRGIGAGISIDFARQGCSHIAITYSSNVEAAKGTISSIEKISPTIKTAAIKADAKLVNFGPEIVTAMLELLDVDHIDIVVSNAALSDITTLQNMTDHTKERFDQFMTANVWSPFQLALAAIPHMPPGGRIINISSVASRRPNNDPVVILGATKAASDAITRALAVAYARDKGITINSVAVGPTNTDAVRLGIERLPKQWSEALYNRASAAHRIAEIEDVTGVVSWLASPASQWVNGNYVPCSGGSMLELQG